MSQKLRYRMIQIGKAPAGLLGLEELFQRVYEEGINPESPQLSGRLIEGVKEHNFVPKTAVKDYEKALSREYQRYFAQKSGDENYRTISYGTWRGYPREHISWFPTIAIELCDGCGRCLDFCSYGVYEQQSDGKPVVVEPFLCRVGCSSCAAVCDPDAIFFPPRDMLLDYRPIG
jgi:NAD-dependent dihydropyrimidine dehydrogenase PreA subunit